MKRPAEAMSLDVGRVSAQELAQISESVRQSLQEANERLAISKAAAQAAEREAEQALAAAISPTTNRGGKSEIAARLVLEDGQVKEIPARRGYGGDHAFIDWMNFTTDESDFFFGYQCISDEEIIHRVSSKCQEIFGFGISVERPTGANFYHRSYVLGDNYGMVCHGGQKSTVLVMLSGEGCAAAREGWEARLHDFLESKCGVRARITRLDLAHDVYDGIRYSVDRADADFDAGLFNCGGRNPNHEYRGNWKQPTGKGRTVYIGNRDNGKFCRVYEKGRQLGDKASEWVRVEVEMKSVNRIIPFDALLRPGEYLAASYPAFAWINERQERIVTIQKKTEIAYTAMVAWLKRQCGAAINVLVAMEGSADLAIAKIIREGEIPSRLKVPDWRFAGESFHEQQRIQPDAEMFFQAAFA